MALDQDFFQLNPEYPDWPIQLHREVEETIEHLFAMEEEPDADGDTPSGDPWCGCQTCLYRETITIAVIRTMEAVRDGKLTMPGVLRVIPATSEDF